MKHTYMMYIVVSCALSVFSISGRQKVEIETRAMPGEATIISSVPAATQRMMIRLQITPRAITDDNRTIVTQIDSLLYKIYHLRSVLGEKPNKALMIQTLHAIKALYMLASAAQNIDASLALAVGEQDPLPISDNPDTRVLRVWLSQKEVPVPTWQRAEEITRTYKHGELSLDELITALETLYENVFNQIQN